MCTRLTAWTVPEINGAYAMTIKQECYTIGGEGGSGGVEIEGLGRGNGSSSDEDD